MMIALWHSCYRLCTSPSLSFEKMQVALILNNPSLFEEWKRDIKTMAGRIIEMRKELFRLLTEELKTPGNWDHIVNQIGMFRYVIASPTLFYFIRCVVLSIFLWVFSFCSFLLP